MVEFKLAIGLNDKITKKQEIETAAALEIVKTAIRVKIGFGTIYKAAGIYTHENGENVTEETIVIEYAGTAADINKMRDLAACLKIEFNQESVYFSFRESHVEFI